MKTETISRGGRRVPGFALGATSYEDAVDAVADATSLERVNEYGETTSGADLTNNQLSAPMNNVLSGCNVPDDVSVTIKVAVKHGRAVGVTVESSDARVAACVDRAVRRLQWPSSPRLDTLTTTF
jgi:hypothetical protein